MYKLIPAAYEDVSAGEIDYMEHPYEAVRRDNEGVVSRAAFRYLACAMAYVITMAERETNTCMWIVVNNESDRLCARVRYENGKVTHTV